MRDDLGVREEKVAPAKLLHGQAVVIEGIVGFVAKSTGLGRYDDPTLAAAKEIAKDETCVVFVGGKHELAVKAATKGLAPELYEVGELVWIDPDDNTILKAKGETNAVPLGVVTEADENRDVLLINCNALNLFI